MSRVVPGISLTIARSSRSSRLTSDDLPTLGRPTIATAVSGSGALGARLARAGSRAHDLVEQVADAVAVLGGDLDDRLEAEREELDRATRAPARSSVLLTARSPARRALRTRCGNLLVARHEPLAPVDDEAPRRRRDVERPQPVLDDQFVQRIRSRAEHSAGIDEREAAVAPLGRRRQSCRGSSRRPAPRSTGGCR